MFTKTAHSISNDFTNLEKNLTWHFRCISFYRILVKHDDSVGLLLMQLYSNFQPEIIRKMTFPGRRRPENIILSQLSYKWLKSDKDGPGPIEVYGKWRERSSKKFSSIQFGSKNTWTSLWCCWSWCILVASGWNGQIFYLMRCFRWTKNDLQKEMYLMELKVWPVPSRKYTFHAQRRELRPHQYLPFKVTLVDELNWFIDW